MIGKETQDTAAFLGEQFWTLLPHLFAERASGGKWKPYKHLQYISTQIARGLIQGGGRYIVTCPPRHGKSQLISNWLPTWFLYNFPERKVILASYAVEFATKWGGQVKENLTENPLILTALSKSTKAKKRFMTLEGGQMITAGIGGPITGEGADLFIIDDPLKNYQEAMSDLIRERQKDWFRSVARTRLEPGASIVILQTRWHEDDLSGWLQSQNDKDDDFNQWTVINLPALCEKDIDELGRKKGEALCPERYDEKNLGEIKKDLGDVIWSALYGQDPVAQKGNIIHGEWIRFYDELPELDEMGLFADLAYKDGEENDFTAIEAWGRKGPDVFLMGQIRDRMPFPTQLDSFERMCALYPEAFHKEIEEKANGAALLQVVRDRINGLSANNPRTSKEARLAAVSPLYKAGNVYYPNPERNPWVKENIKEITKFPRYAFDDTVDVASMAVKHLGRMSSTIARLEALAKW